MEAKELAADLKWEVRQYSRGDETTLGIVMPEVSVVHPVISGLTKNRTEFIVRACNAHDALVKFAEFVLSGLKAGHIKSKPIIDFSNPDAENLEIQSLHSLARAALAKAGVA